MDSGMNLPIQHIPLAAFDSPIKWNCCVKGECNGGHKPVQRSGGSKDDRIHPDRTYLAKIHGSWFFGTFSSQWYGWSFNNWGTSGIQLDSIEDLYEVDMTVLERNDELCWSRGPRIGREDVIPLCKQPLGHEGWHRPAPEDGWSADVVWGDPALRQPPRDP